MGVEYRHYLIPKPNDFMPKPEDLERFIGRAAAENWVPYDKPEVRRGGKDRILSWRIESPAIAYPLAPVDVPPQDRTFEIQIHVSSDFVYHASECIDPFESSACACGTQLDYDSEDELFTDLRLPVACPVCGKAFDPSDLPAAYRHPVTGEESLLRGGASYRFAIVIDCGKCVPSESKAVTADPRFLELCQTELKAPFYEVGDVY